ncbi:MAG: type II toxin-antitoxin system VapC family toxin [Aestuariivirga sp.]
MILPDVNVLVSAHRADHPNHDICRTWLNALVSSGERFCVSPLVLSSTVRIVTNRKVFFAPSSLREAVNFCNDLLDHPLALKIHGGDGHWGIFCRLCTTTGILGSDISDVWLAALAIEHDCEWVTLDRDFSRFPGLRWRTP